jgi:tetratricopeptide (TPR) repeat protein
MKECIRVLRSLQGNDSIEVATALFSLGELYELHLIDHRKALRCFEESLRIRKLNSHESDDASEQAQTYLHLGHVHTSLGGFEKAHFCFDQAMELCIDDDEGTDNDLTVEAEVAKGLVFSAQGNNQDAIVQLIRAYGGLQMIHFNRGGKDEEMGDLLCQRSSIYCKMGEIDDALDDLDFALQYYYPAIGKDHWKVAEANHAMAEMHLKKSDNEKALASANQALRIRKALFGDSDERTGDSSYIVGKVYFAWNDFEKARPHLEAALSAHREARGTRNLAIITDSLYFLGCIYGESSSFPVTFADR